MYSKRWFHRSSWTVGLASAIAGIGLPAHATVFSNTTTITTPAIGQANVYPSVIAVSGLSGNISSLTVSLVNVNHARPDDLELLLVSPTGQKFILLSDAGGTTTPVSAATITFSDAAANLIPDTGALTAGSWKPTCVNFQGDIESAGHFPSPAPASPYQKPASSLVGGTGGGTATLNGTFGGLNPNGTWNLYVIDDFQGNPGESGAITGGWSLDITASVSTASTTTTVSSSANPSTTGSPVTFTASVVSGGNPVTLGSVTFLDGATSLGTVAMNISGQATILTSSLTEGTHTITASYGGAVGFAASQSTLTQTVNTATVVTGNQFCNPGGLFLSAAAPSTASAYPSRMFVSGLAGTISKVTVTLNDITINNPDDLELLLVGPGGQNMVILGDAGGLGTPASLVDLVLDDSASSLVPDGGPLTTGTFRPTSVNSSVTVFPAPAPAAPYAHAAPSGSTTLATTFNGINPNGTWELYALDDILSGGGTIGSWCLTFTTTGDAATTTTLSSSPNLSTTGQAVTFTAQVRRSDNNAAVTSGSVIFREGNTALSGNVALNGSGVATFVTSSLIAKTHTISVDYSGVPGSFNTSTAATSQQVDTATTVNNNQFCNPGAITVVQPGGPTADVYPSRIQVQNAGGTVTKVTVALQGISTDQMDDLDVLLVGPGGQKFVVLADAGGLNAASNLNLVLDDAAANALPDTTLPASGTYQPGAFLGVSFPSPAPVSPGLPAPLGGATFASVFNGINPNGYWSLYLVDDTGTFQSTVITSWCLTLETTPAVSCPADITVNVAPGSCNSAPVNLTATATGLPAPTIAYSLNGNPITSPHAFPVGVNVVTASVAVGVTCTFQVVVVDNISPVITCPTTVVAHVPANASSGVVTFATPGASDNCSASVVCVPPSGSTFPVGTTTVVCTATDPALNTDTCSFSVTVNRVPVPGTDSLGATEGVSVLAPVAKLLANDRDSEGQSLAILSVQNPSAGGATVTLIGSTVSYTAPLGLVGSDTFQYVVQDSAGGTAVGLVNVIIRSADAAGGNLVSVTVTPTSRIIHFAGIPGFSYLIQSAAAVTGPWSNLSPPIVASATGRVDFTDSEVPPPPVRFYRTVLAP